MSATKHIQELVPDRFEPLVSGKQFWQFLSVGVVGAGADTATLVSAPSCWACRISRPKPPG